ncbi:MAG: DUF1080 domain-containing protein [Bacteroidetes bacterium]|nr:DUF1080 domain-containing protein [Bacteroidota bacterium]
MKNLLFLTVLICFHCTLKADPGKDWISLFDGRSLSRWHHFNGSKEIKNWRVENGALVCLGAKGPSGSGDIITDRSFRNFELRWDWKLEKGSNSGVFYHVVEDVKYKRAIETSPEYQIMDEADFPTKLDDTQLTGADYAMYSPKNRKASKPVGEWNSSAIIFRNGRVEHWLNGIRIVKFQAWTKAWNKRKLEGKWKDYPDYGLSPEGKIGLQDHGNKAYFRNIRVRAL